MKMKLSECQKRFWLDSFLHPDDSNNISALFCLKGDLDRDLLVWALNRTVEENEAIHSFYRQEGAGEVQMEIAEGVPVRVDYVTEIEEGRCEELADKYGRRLFDLSRELPVRMLLIRRFATEHRMVLAFHHICFDALSVSGFFSRWSEFYNAGLEGVKRTEEAEVSWKEYTDWEQVHCLAKDEALAYWRRFFREMPLGTDFPGRKSGREGEYLDFKLGRKLKEEVKRLASDLHVTPFWVMMSAWLWVVAVYSGGQKAVVSYAVNIRPGKFKRLLGPFVNNLACGADLTDNPGFDETLRGCIAQRWRTKKFQYVFLTEVADNLRKEGILQGDAPFLNVGINYAEWGEVEGFCLNGVKVKFCRRIPTTPQFDLMLEVMPDGAGRSRIIYRKGMGRKFAHSVQGSFIRLLEQVCQEPSVRFSEVIFQPEKSVAGTEAWERKMRERFRDVVACFERRVRKEKERTALYLEDRSFSYRVLGELTLRVACAVRRGFREMNGGELTPGTPVGICVGRDCNYVAAVLGVLKSGGAYVPLDPSFPAERLGFMVEDCGIRLVLTTQRLAGKSGCGNELLLEEALEEIPDEKEIFPRPVAETPAYVIYTSGTTGRPKGVTVSHWNLFCFMQNAFRFLQLTPGCRQLQYANLGFDVSVSELFPALVCGATVCVASEEERRNPQLLLRRMERMRIEVAYVAPVMLARMRGKLPDLRTLVVAGESTSAEVLAYWGKGRRLLNGYGPTESTVYATLCERKEGDAAEDIGLPLQGVSCYVLDKYGRQVPDGVSGELYIGGCQLTEGYIGRPELNQEKFVRYRCRTGRMEKTVRLYRTGDSVRRLPNGHLLFLGRTDFQVKIRGFRIELGEIESCLEAMDGVGQVLVTVREEGELKRLVAYVQTEIPEGLRPENLRKELERLLPAYMIPSAFVFLRQFPVSFNGKIDRRALPEPVWGEREYVAPATVSEKLLAEVAGRILGIGRLSVEEDLFVLGLSSLNAVAFVAEAEQKGIKVTVSDIYRQKTVRRIAAVEKDKVCHWLKGTEGEQGIVVLVCGHMDFGSLLSPLAEALSQRYAVLVIDSYHDYGKLLPEEAGFPEWIDFYERILRKEIAAEKRVCAFAGHCLGGEIAYALAARWRQNPQALPEVWLFNSRAKRAEAEICLKQEKLCSEIQCMLWRTAMKKKVLTDRLIRTEVLPEYPGRVVLFAAGHFTERLIGPDLPAITDRELLEYLRKAYEQNEDHWRQLAPRLTVKTVEGDHWSMLKRENLDFLIRSL